MEAAARLAGAVAGLGAASIVEFGIAAAVRPVSR
jgi:hypothetical protein